MIYKTISNPAITRNERHLLADSIWMEDRRRFSANGPPTSHPNGVVNHCCWNYEPDGRWLTHWRESDASLALACNLQCIRCQNDKIVNKLSLPSVNSYISNSHSAYHLNFAHWFDGRVSRWMLSIWPRACDTFSFQLKSLSLVLFLLFSKLIMPINK